MANGRRLSRRAFVVGGATAVGAGVAVRWVDHEYGRAAPPAADPGTDTDGLAGVGRAFLADRPDEADLAALVSSVPLLRDATSRSDVRAVLPDLAAAARADFRTGDVVVVGGWRLALTEARAAAIVALLPA